MNIRQFIQSQQLWGIYESSLSSFFVVFKIRASITVSDKCTENPMSLRRLASYFPEDDTSRAISGFRFGYLVLSSF
jgi:hypothetical protein